MKKWPIPICSTNREWMTLVNRATDQFNVDKQVFNKLMGLQDGTYLL